MQIKLLLNNNLHIPNLTSVFISLLNISSICLETKIKLLFSIETPVEVRLTAAPDFQVGTS